ncbi:DUF3099 domain-containing protein [Oerskovia enterophila]|uniref:DUF3099 domain-containing protein n=2 Tax=Oerskovia enterophila TaxID=43678 RepID=A0A161YED1_9CELL|nr:DUF3099 domain-containing protein [Oerskovia enterophila]KZM34138.1 hypothetical protein OJAG_32900 [Oerskovia enterophila]
MSSNNKVPSISDAPESLAQDQARRTKRYLIQMGIRLVCFLAAVIVHGWFSFVLIGAAIVLPYVAVLLVNAGRDQRTYDVSPMERLQVEAAPDHPSLGRVVELDDEGRVRREDPDSPAAPDAPAPPPTGEPSDRSAAGPATDRPTDHPTDRPTQQEPHDG